MIKKLLTTVICLIALSISLKAERGSDLLRIFKRAHEGKPLTCVAIGGSITQAGKGWIGPALRKSFPKSIVTMHNAGMSATGSILGMFRVDRDVISCQPDLVLIEYAVNDGGAKDDDAIWTVESMVRRLKMLDNPPAIVFIMAASTSHSKIYRHQKVANHYKLLSVNLDAKSHSFLKKNKLPWKTFFGDNVHPNSKGHEFYSKAIMEELSPYIKRATAYKPAPPAPLPKQLSKRKLILDGRMVPIAIAPGWHKEHKLPHWWDMFFMGVTCAKKPGTTMQIPFRGTVVGLYCALSKKYGKFYANIDGNGMKEVVCNNREGYRYSIFAKELSPEKHLLNIALPEDSEQGQGVKLGFLLLGGETGAKNTLAPQGKISPGKLKKITFKDLSSKWFWCGPFGNTNKKWKDNKALNTVFVVEQENSGFNAWKKINSSKLDFARLTGYKDRGICYAKTIIQSKTARREKIFLRIDYWGKIWFNGKLVLTVDKGHGPPYSPIVFDVELKKGRNTIMIKVHSGSKGNNFSLKIEK